MHRIVLFIISIALAFNITAQTVYTTKTGEKYHKSNCRYLKYSKKELTIEKAALGYQPCSVCKPVAENNKPVSKSNLSSSATKSASTNKQIAKAIATQCTGKTKSGSRCKRKTKSANGKCYQH